MTVVPIVPASPDADVPSSIAAAAPSASAESQDPAQLFSGLVQAFAQGDGALSSAQAAENAFAAGHGDLQTMVFERARADALLQVATGAASRVTQALGTISQMQV